MPRSAFKSFANQGLCLLILRDRMGDKERLRLPVGPFLSEQRSGPVWLARNAKLKASNFPCAGALQGSTWRVVPLAPGLRSCQKPADNLGDGLLGLLHRAICLNRHGPRHNASRNSAVSCSLCCTHSCLRMCRDARPKYFVAV